MRNTTVTLQALCAECIINGKLFDFPMDIQTVPLMLHEKIWDLVALRNRLTHKFREVEHLICALLSTLPKEFINIVFNWTVEDMEEQDDKEAILILTQLRDEHFWGNEE